VHFVFRDKFHGFGFSFIRRRFYHWVVP
jgi:hypothetical protein